MRNVFVTSKGNFGLCTIILSKESNVSFLNTSCDQRNSDGVQATWRIEQDVSPNFGNLFNAPQAVYKNNVILMKSQLLVQQFIHLLCFVQCLFVTALVSLCKSSRHQTILLSFHYIHNGQIRIEFLEWAPVPEEWYSWHLVWQSSCNGPGVRMVQTWFQNQGWIRAPQTIKLQP